MEARCVLIALAAMFLAGPQATALSWKVIKDERPARTAGDTADPMFPDGLSHDFGVVARGIQPEHRFRVVNTSNWPLQIISVRTSMSPATVHANKVVLGTNEEGTLEIKLDTRRFVGQKTVTFFLTMSIGNSFRETRFWVNANSRE
jgi:hypothetical protein